MKRIINVDLDLNRQDRIPARAELVKNDLGNILIKARVFDSGKPVDLSDYKAVIKFLRSDRVSCGEALCEVNGNEITAEVYAVALKVPGVLVAEISLLKGEEQKLTLQQFFVNVRESIDTSEAYEDVSVLPIIEQLLHRVEVLEDRLEPKASYDRFVKGKRVVPKDVVDSL